jgi:hypothetical protein
MKATGTGAVIGIALETFDTDRYYSTTYINQYGDDLMDTPENQLTLEELANTPTETTTLTGTTTEVNVGQIVMLVDLSYRYLDDSTTNALATLMGTPGQSATLTESEDSVLPGAGQEETLFARLTTLAKSFVDGVLSVFTLEANRVELTSELCLNDTCIAGADLQVLIDSLDGSTQLTVIDDETSGEVSVDMSTEEPVVSTVATSTGTSTEMIASGEETATSSAPVSLTDESATTTETGESDSAITTNPDAVESGSDESDVTENTDTETPAEPEPPETDSTPAETAPEPPTPPAPTPVVEASEVTSNEET